MSFEIKKDNNLISVPLKYDWTKIINRNLKRTKAFIVTPNGKYEFCTIYYYLDSDEIKER